MKDDKIEGLVLGYSHFTENMLILPFYFKSSDAHTVRGATSKLHDWFKIYRNFAELVYFAYWWSCIGLLSTQAERFLIAGMRDFSVPDIRFILCKT